MIVIDCHILSFLPPSLPPFLPSFLCTSHHTARLVRLNPQILLLDSKTIAPRIAFVKKMFPKSPKLLMRMPALLQRDPELSVLPKMKAIGELLPGMDILRLIRYGIGNIYISVLGIGIQLNSIIFIAIQPNDMSCIPL